MEGTACHRRAGLVDVLVKSLHPRLRIFPLSESFLQRLYGRGNNCTSTTRSAPSIDPMKEHRSRIGKAVQNNCSPLDGQASPRVQHRFRDRRTHSHNCSDKPGQWAFYLIIGALVIIGVLVAGADEAPPRSAAVGLLIGGAAGLENKWGASIAVLLA
jgi:hypothetical protein